MFWCTAWTACPFLVIMDSETKSSALNFYNFNKNNFLSLSLSFNSLLYFIVRLTSFECFSSLFSFQSETKMNYSRKHRQYPIHMKNTLALQWSYWDFNDSPLIKTSAESILRSPTFYPNPTSKTSTKYFIIIQNILHSNHIS